MLRSIFQKLVSLAITRINRKKGCRWINRVPAEQTGRVPAAPKTKQTEALCPHK
nr:hypothetical protein [uncultured Desulfobacter sp.]